MKKTIASALLIVAFMPFLASAQTFTEDQTAQISALIERITSLKIQLILAEIADLQAQINAMQAVSITPIQQPSVNTGGGSTNVTPIVTPAPQVVTPSFILGSQSCVSGQADTMGVGGAVIPVSITGVSPSYFLIHASSTDGQGYWGGQSYQNVSSGNIDTLPAGTYDYYVKAYTGTTAPFTEDTWQDTRVLALSTSGSMTVTSCQ